MSKSALVSAVADSAGITSAAASKAVDAVFDEISRTLAQNGKFAVPGFGTFVVRELAARSGRNPMTGEPLQIAASKSVRLRPASALKSSIALKS